MKTTSKIIVGAIFLLAFSPLTAFAAGCTQTVSSPATNGRLQAQNALSTFMSSLKK